MALSAMASRWAECPPGLTDRSQDRGGGRLAVEGVGQVAIARFPLREQADVLDGDHGLAREGLQQRDLLIGERLDDPPRDGDGSQRPAVAEQGHREDRAEDA